jgi:hypothetical protein
MPRSELIDRLNSWAADYYPGRQSPPPSVQRGLSEADLFALFNATTSAEHHLALVDLEPVRRSLEFLSKGSPARAALKSSWARHLAAARARSP